ncbi:MAG TPA: hypothetical protein VFW20_02810, partial [Candidatus Limnocylindrales bacterium]|nr:hypothetical protein [Candidatus Limnocylindrales bacterium]
MSPSQRSTRYLVVLVVVLLVAACAGTPGSAAPSGSSGSGGPSEIAGLPELGLTNVATEAANARAATIGPAGGTITATAADGTTFSLVVPANAVSRRMTIAMYPVGHLNGLPGGESLTAGVQFSPDGLELGAAATLTITLPVGVDPSKLAGIAWRGDGRGPIPVLSQTTGQSITLEVEHFSGAGTGTVPLVPLGPCDTQDKLYNRIEDDLHEAARNEPNAAPDLKSDLKDCYQNLIKPNLVLESKGSIVDDVTEADATVDAYDLWREGIDLGGGFFAGFTVSPELAESKALAAAFLGNWFSSYNLECIGNADQPHTAILDAYLALETPHAKAHEWGIETKANQLDYESLLDKLCVQVVIDPSRSYSASKPGDKGTVTVPVGYSIDGQAVRHDQPIDVELTVAGEGAPFSDADAPPDGHVSVPLTWPDGVDPVKIDILASFDFGGTISDLARFDRITKSSGKPVTVTAPTGAWSGEKWPVVWGTCVRQFLAVDDGEDWTFSVSGASIFATAGDSVTFIGSNEGVVAVSGHSPTFGSATYSGYM